MIFKDTSSGLRRYRTPFARILFNGNTDWRAVIHAIQNALCKTQAQMAVEAGVSQAAVSCLYQRTSKAPRYQLGRTLERLYDSIPCDVLRRLPPVPALNSRFGDEDAMHAAEDSEAAHGRQA